VFARTAANVSFSRTDYFSIVAHFIFLQVPITITLNKACQHSAVQHKHN
jgi:hypothetical protein